MDFRLAYERLCMREKRQNFKYGIKTTHDYINHHWQKPKEIHHILPKSLGGRNAAANFVALSHEKHVYAHVLLNLAFAQEGNEKALVALGYTSLELPMEFILKQHAMKSVKVSIPIEGKKRPALVMSIAEAAKYFCFATRKNFNDKNAFYKAAAIVLRNAVFKMPYFGMKMHIVFNENN